MKKLWYMYGFLFKKKEGWVILYIPDDCYHVKKEIQLHPYQDPNFEFGEDMNGKEVKFNIVEFWETGIEVPFKVANLILPNNDVKKDVIKEDEVKNIGIDFLEKQYNENGKLTAVDFYQAKQIELKAKENTYTEEQVREAYMYGRSMMSPKNFEKYFQSLKQPKNPNNV